jgi:hypothetical protein
MPRVGFEHTIPASERANTVHALDSWATVTGVCNYTCHISSSRMIVADDLS